MHNQNKQGFILTSSIETENITVLDNEGRVLTSGHGCRCLHYNTCAQIQFTMSCWVAKGRKQLEAENILMSSLQR